MNYFEEVGKFHTAFNHPKATSPTVLETSRAVARSTWTAEEVVEFIHQSSTDIDEFEAAMNQFRTGVENAYAKSKAMPLPVDKEERLLGQIDAAVDQLYFVMGTFNELGVDPKEFFAIVQAANMAKLGPNGKPIIRESDGKIMKPEGWEPPEAKMKLLLAKQLEEKGDGRMKKVEIESNSICSCCYEELSVGDSAYVDDEMDIVCLECAK